MNQLTILNVNGGLMVDSREIAEMVEKDHKHLLRDIEVYKEVLESSSLDFQDFFIKDSYKVEGNNKTYPCYLLTKKGCDMVANKMIGKKGVLFTAEYVTAFEDMKEKLRKPMPKLSKELQAIFVLDERTERLESEVKDLRDNSPLFNIECKELQGLVRKVGTKALGGYRSPAYKDNSLRAKVYKDIQGQLKREFGVDKYEAIKRIQLDKAKEIVTNYKVPIVTQDEITLLNNQIRM